MKSSSKVVASIVAGAAVGAALGVLYAPDKGSNTRNKISRKSGEFVGGIKQKANHLVETVKSPFLNELQDANGKANQPHQANQAKGKFTELK